MSAFEALCVGEHKLVLAFFGNVTFTGVSLVIARLLPILSAFLITIQIAVAVATFVHIARKRKKEKDHAKNPPPVDPGI